MKITPKQRAQKELKKLIKKIKKLESFIDSNEFNEIEELQQSLLFSQGTAMATYANILSTRIDIWTEEREDRVTIIDVMEELAKVIKEHEKDLEPNKKDTEDETKL